MSDFCAGRVKLSKKLQADLGRSDDACFAFAPNVCPDCGKCFCKWHLNKHNCKKGV